eukprot:c11860_g1_i2.p1 GENE.c11860_g1_i2~~c11860_g1_i2.p1  ORF type:complete len:380 (-),score=64.58 c11860_g1_i2:394-1533(-)
MKRASEPFIKTRAAPTIGSSLRTLNVRGSKTRSRVASSFSSNLSDAMDTKHLVVKFNLDPRKTLRTMIANGDVENSPVAVAKFLRNTKGLSKTAIGEYICREDEFVRHVFGAFMAEVDMQGQTFDLALRSFVDGWKMPGEAQVVDRSMQRFAKHYCEANPTIFTNPDTGYILAFSLIMLNSDLHNPNIKLHMTMAQFVANNRGIDNGSDLPKEQLETLYRSIEQNPLKLDDDSIRYGECVTFCLNNLEGWLLKRSSHSTSTWNRRWFVLTDGCLYYFDHPHQGSPKCIFPLEDVRVRSIQATTTDFEIFPRTDIPLKSVKTSTGGIKPGARLELVLRASTESERDNWIDAISQESTTSPLSELWKRKKILVSGATATHP